MEIYEKHNEIEMTEAVKESLILQMLIPILKEKKAEILSVYDDMHGFCLCVKEGKMDYLKARFNYSLIRLKRNSHKYYAVAAISYATLAFVYGILKERCIDKFAEVDEYYDTIEKIDSKLNHLCLREKWNNKTKEDEVLEDFLKRRRPKIEKLEQFKEDYLSLFQNNIVLSKTITQSEYVEAFNINFISDRASTKYYEGEIPKINRKIEKLKSKKYLEFNDFIKNQKELEMLQNKKHNFTLESVELKYANEMGVYAKSKGVLPEQVDGLDENALIIDINRIKKLIALCKNIIKSKYEMIYNISQRLASEKNYININYICKSMDSYNKEINGYNNDYDALKNHLHIFEETLKAIQNA